MMSVRNEREIIVCRPGSVTGVGSEDEVCLVGTKTADSPYLEGITLLVRNSRTGRVMQVTPAQNGGYSPTLYLADFTGDGVDDVKLSIASGGSGGMVFTYVYSFAGNRIRLLFSGEDYDNSQNYRAYYIDGFTVVVEDLNTKQSFSVDVSQDPAAQDLYDQGGTLKEPTEANVGPFILAWPIVFNESTGVNSLLAATRVYGTFAADTFATIYDRLEWDGRRFASIWKELAVFPYPATLTD